MQLDACALSDPRNELRSVGGIAQRSGCSGAYPLDAQSRGGRGELLDGGECKRGGIGIETPVLIDPAAEPRDAGKLGQDLRLPTLVHLGGEHQDGVRADVEGRELHRGSPRAAAGAEAEATGSI